MRDPRPENGRVARSYEHQGSFSDGRLGPRTEGLNYHNSYNIVVYVRLCVGTPIKVYIYVWFTRVNVTSRVLVELMKISINALWLYHTLPIYQELLPPSSI